MTNPVSEPFVDDACGDVDGSEVVGVCVVDDELGAVTDDWEQDPFTWRCTAGHSRRYPFDDRRVVARDRVLSSYLTVLAPHLQLPATVVGKDVPRTVNPLGLRGRD